MTRRDAAPTSVTWPTSRELVLLIVFVWVSTASLAFTLKMNSVDSWPYHLFLIVQLALVLDLVALVGISRSRTSQSLHLPLALLVSTLTALPLSIGVPGNLYGYDSHLNYAASVDVSRNGWNSTAFTSYSPLQGVTPWPALDVLASTVNLIGNIPLLEVARFGPLFLSMVGLLSIYCIVKSLFGARVAVLSVVAVGTSFLWISTSDVYVRNSIGSALFWPLAFVTFRKTRARSARLLGVSFILGTTIVFAHSLTSLMLIILFGYLAVQRPLRWTLTLVHKQLGMPSTILNRLVGKAPSDSMLFATMIFLVIVIAYWTYIFSGPLQVFGRFVDELSSGYQVSRPVYLPRVLNTRLYLALGGTFAFLGGGTAVIAFRALRDPDFSVQQRSYSLLGPFIFLVGEGSTLFRTLYLDTFRFIGFAWPFLIPALLHETRREPPTRSRIPVLLLVGFVFFNLMIIPPSNVDHKAVPDYSASEYRLYFYPSELKAIEFLHGCQAVAGDQAIWHLVSSYVPESSVEVDLSLFNGNLRDLSRYDCIVVRSEDFGIVFNSLTNLPATRLTSTTYDRLLHDPRLNVVYSDNAVVVFNVASAS